MHRVRMSVAHFPTHGWLPSVLAVEPISAERLVEPRLLETIPPDLAVRRVGALPSRFTRRLGFGGIAFRSMPALYAAGCDLLKRTPFDLVYFSTTAFPVMALGPIWKWRFGVPFVVDMQDPWVNDYYSIPGHKKPPNHQLAGRLHRLFERWTMRHVGGMIAVSDDYIATLKRRYPWLATVPAATVPFGGSSADFDVLQRRREPNRFFTPRDGNLNGVYVGRGGADMGTALRIMFGALRRGLVEQPTVFSRVRLHFVGTDYAPPERAQKSVEAVAAAFGVASHVIEDPRRIPYFEALQLLLDADFLLVPGSDDPQYTASKIFPYILAGRPLLGVFHDRSSVCDILEATRKGNLVRFRGDTLIESATDAALRAWTTMLADPRSAVVPGQAAFTPHSAKQKTKEQVTLFNRVVADQAAVPRKGLAPLRRLWKSASSQDA
jgi:hypothetical protein